MLKKKFLIKILSSIVLSISGLSHCTILDPNEPGNLVPPTVDEDENLPSLKINGTNLHLQTFGDPANKKVFVLHGGPGMDSRYMLKLKSLQDQFYVIIFDQRGAGLSRRHDYDIYNTELYLSDLNALVNYFTNPAEQVIFIGHSWGGIYANAYINKYPAKVSQVVHIESGAYKGSRQKNTVTYSLSDTMPNEFIWNNEFISNDSHAKADYSLMVSIAEDPHPLYHFNHSDPMPWYRYGAVVSEALPNSRTDANGNPSWDETKNLYLFTNEALFIRGELNEIMNYEFHLEQMSDYPNASLVTINSVGHDLIWVKYAEVETAIRNYLIP